MDSSEAETPHELVEFMRQVGSELQSEYDRIRSRAAQDPGTAGDEGEGNWAAIFKDWLPPAYHVVTKGRILTSLGDASPQVDVVILHPDYPKKLLEKKHYLSSGVLAAFECKNTLNIRGIRQAAENARSIARILHRESGNKGYWRPIPAADPVHRELHKPIIYGLLAHSHGWSLESVPNLITTALNEHSLITAEHPREVIDVVCVADLAVWSIWHRAQTFAVVNGRVTATPPICASSFTCLHPSKWKAGSIYQRSMTPIGSLLSRLYQKLSHYDTSALLAANYFRAAIKDGSSGGEATREWANLLPSHLVRLLQSQGDRLTSFA